jgi:hypothetical protein
LNVIAPAGLPQEGHHAEIVLEGVQTDPWKHVLPGNEVLVVGLVHVPEERNLSHGVGVL